MFVVTEACVEKSLTTGTGVSSLSNSVTLNDEFLQKLWYSNS